MFIKRGSVPVTGSVIYDKGGIVSHLSLIKNIVRDYGGKINPVPE